MTALYHGVTLLLFNPAVTHPQHASPHSYGKNAYGKNARPCVALCGLIGFKAIPAHVIDRRRRRVASRHASGRKLSMTDFPSVG
jgi:hypothetical protein